MDSPRSTPRKSRKPHGGSKKESKNPYSSRGLDKFSALLAELEEKKQKIYAKIDRDDAPLGRFVFTRTGDCVPIVIKDRPKSPSSPSGKEKKRKNVKGQDVKEKIAVVTQDSKVLNESKGNNSFKEMKQSQSQPDSDKKLFPLSENLHKINRPSYCLPMTMALVLVLLALFGRSAAILWTCIAWYTVPTLTDQNNRERKVEMKKKDFTRRLSNESKGSFNHRPRDYAALKEKFPSLLARGRSA